MSSDLLFDIGETIGKAEIVEVQDEQPKKVRDHDMWTPLPFAPLTGAAFSPCRKFRYGLWRRMREKGDTCLFLLLNPSTADEIKNDPTVERCERYAKSWGYARLLVANIFAFRATDPKKLKWTEDPVGPDNNQWINKLAELSKLIVCGWGNHGELYNRATLVKTYLTDWGHKLHCLKKNKDGSPAHPLYLRADLKPVEI